LVTKDLSRWCELFILIKHDMDFIYKNIQTRFFDTAGMATESMVAGGSRPGSNTSGTRRAMQDDKYPTSLTKSRSGSGVPELESVVPGGGGGGRSASAGRRSASGERTAARSAMAEAEEEGGMRPASTGFTHLDEFERKLAEMEVELLQEDEETEDISRLHTTRHTEWILFPNYDLFSASNYFFPSLFLFQIFPI
jgi:hypothetical protein